MSALLERERELVELQTFLAAAQSGQGGVAAVTGPAGIGKSTLLRTATNRIPALVATPGPLEVGIPFEVVRALFARRVGRAAAAERDVLLGGPARAAAPLLGFGGRGETSEPAFALHGLFWLAQELAAREPLVLVVDDAHWADEPSLRFLAYLARRIDELSVALLLAVRTATSLPPPLEEIVHAPATRRIAPPPLSPGAAAVLGGAADADVVAAAAGNPFLIVSGARGPDALAAAVDRRLAELGAPARAVGEAVALLAGAAEVAALAQLSGLPATDVAAALDRLADAGLVDLGPPLRAAHPLLADALLARLGAMERAAAHGRAARALHRLGADPERVASHLLAAPATGDPDAVEWLRTAAAGAASAGAPEAAVRFLERALSEPPSGEQRAAVELELGTFMTRAGRPEGVQHLLSVLESDDEPAQQPAIAIQILQIASLAGAHEAVDRALALSSPDVSQLDAARLFVDLMWDGGGDAEPVRRHAGPDTIAGRFCASVLALQAALAGRPVTDVERYAHTALGSRADYERALEAGVPLLWAPAALLQVGLSTQELAARIELAIASARRRGTVLGLVATHASSAEHALARGRPEHVLEDARTALELSHGLGLRSFDVLVGVTLARAFVLCGDPPAARHAIEALPAVDPAGYIGLAAALASAEVLVSEGNLENARVALEQVGAVATSCGFSSANALDWRAPLARVLLAQGRSEAAAQVAVDGLEAARASGGPLPLNRALRAAALTGPVALRTERLEAALAALDRSEGLLERAETLLELGAHLRRTAERRRAREPLATALELAVASGLAVVAERAREELLASGARPRRDRRWGAEALTPSELRVARLAIEGMTNREIAGELFITPKTVEAHLGRCYRKLDVTGRDELAAALDA